MFSSSSYAGWTKVTEYAKGTFYVDFERIREHDGYVYYWVLIDYFKSFAFTDSMSSAKIYNQGDCKLFRYRGIEFSFHKEPMGAGENTLPIKFPPDKWTYPHDDMHEVALKQVCNR